MVFDMKDEIIIHEEPPYMPDCYYARWEIIEMYCGWNPTKNKESENEK